MPKVYQNIFSLLTHFAHDFLAFSYGNTTECLCAPLEKTPSTSPISIQNLAPPHVCTQVHYIHVCQMFFLPVLCKENTFNCVAILYNMRWPLETVAVYYKHTHKNSTANKRKIWAESDFMTGTSIWILTHIFTAHSRTGNIETLRFMSCPLLTNTEMGKKLFSAAYIVYRHRFFKNWMTLLCHEKTCNP